MYNTFLGIKNFTFRLPGECDPGSSNYKGNIRIPDGSFGKFVDILGDKRCVRICEANICVSLVICESTQKMYMFKPTIAIGSTISYMKIIFGFFAPFNRNIPNEINER